ncbi:MAG: TIGR01244 family phosphatase [Alphaproteobacteria bacterium]|nr:TIGR01244 family phosphatase [Alphaproteobacteria bacterium]
MDRVRTIINNRPDGEETVQMPAAVAGDEAKRHGLAYVYIPVTSSTISAADVAAFERALTESPKPIVAHCRSGTRTYLLWAAGQALGGKADPATMVATAAAKGYDIKTLPDLVARLRRA